MYEEAERAAEAHLAAQRLYGDDVVDPGGAELASGRGMRTRGHVSTRQKPMDHRVPAPGGGGPRDLGGARFHGDQEHPGHDRGDPRPRRARGCARRGVHDRAYDVRAAAHAVHDADQEGGEGFSLRARVLRRGVEIIRRTAPPSRRRVLHLRDLRARCPDDVTQARHGVSVDYLPQVFSIYNYNVMHICGAVTRTSKRTLPRCAR